MIKKIRTRILPIVLLLCISALVEAQDARWSQINSAPLMLNSALTGRTKGGIDFGILSSNQSTDLAQNTHQHVFLHANSDHFKYLKGKIDSVSSTVITKKINSYWGFGLSYYQNGKDLLGFNESTMPLNASFYSLSVAKHFYRTQNNGDKHYFGLGIAVVAANGKLNESVGLKYDNEIAGGGFRYRPTFANNATSQRNYFDWNLGFYYGFRSSSFYFETGLGLNHVLHPRMDIFDDEETKLRVRGTLHSQFGINLSKKFMISQKNVFWREGLYLKSSGIDTSLKNEIWSGVELNRRDNSSKKVKFEGGIYTRSLKTIMPYGSLLIGQSINLRLSYEWPISNATYKSYTANRFETALVFSFGKSYFGKNQLFKNQLNW
jgi:hypothetical protein